MATEAADQPEGRVLLLPAPDGSEWAHFIATRLSAPVYNMACKICTLTGYDDDDTDGTTPSITKAVAEAENVYCNDGSALHNGDESDNVYETTFSADLVRRKEADAKPEVPEKRTSQDTDANDDTNVYAKQMNASRACVLLVSPSVVESNRPLPLDIHSLKPGSTVFLFLGVTLGDARDYFGPDADAVFKCKCGFVDSTEHQTITDALIQIIEAYEDTGESVHSEENDEIYDVPTNSRQLNVVEKVFPRRLTEKERDVFILLSWPPEDSLHLFLECDDGTDHKLDMRAVGERLYTFTLPDGLVGDVHFHLECQEQKFGRSKVRVPSKLDQLRDLLDGEIDPLKLLASAVNLSKADVGDLDVTLAHKLQQLSPAVKLQTLFPFEDEIKQSQTDRPSSVKWPTLLHFAAEWNLRTLCCELLRYPGMVLAACTENSDGEFPSQIAFRKGFTDLETDLLQYMEKERETESEYMEPSPPLPPPRTVFNPETGRCPPKVAPKPSRPFLKKDDGQLYLDMSATGRISPKNGNNRKPRALSESTLFWKTFTFRRFSQGRQRSGSDALVTPRPDSTVAKRINASHSFGQGDTQAKLTHAPLRLSNSHSEDLYMSMDNNAVKDMEEQFDLPDEPTTPDTPQPPPSANDSPTSRKALKCLGVSEEEVRASFIGHKKQANTQVFLSASTPPGHRLLRNSMFYVDDPRLSLSSNWEEDIKPPEQVISMDSKRSLKKEKIKSFFSKITGSTRRYDANSGKKSKSRRGSESSDTKSLGKSQLTFDMERDSGSYSDEDNEPKILRHRSKQSRTFKQSDKAMTRRLSRRVQTAQNETISNYPNLPGDRGKNMTQL